MRALASRCLIPLLVTFLVTFLSLAQPAQASAVSPHSAFRYPVPAPVHTAARVTVLRHWTVRSGQTLSSIARAELGSGSRWPSLWWWNREKIKNPDLIRNGQVLLVWRYRAVSGDWLTQLAMAAIGRAPSPQLPAARPASPAADPVPSDPAPAPAPQPVPQGSLQAYAQQLFGAGFGCISSVINVESGWNVYATNPKSGAYGIPQALPGSKMASAGSDWATDGFTQLRWMSGYVDSVYGGACGAWAHEQADGWY